jgi:hypothetical protein
VSLPTSLTSFSVISAKASAADRCRSTLSEKERVVNAARGDPVKKLVVVRSDQGRGLAFTRDHNHAVAGGRGKVTMQKRGAGQPTFEVLQEIGNCLALVLQQERLVRVLPPLSTWSRASSVISSHAAHGHNHSQQLLQTPPMMLMRCHPRCRMSPICAYELRRLLGTKGGYAARDEVVRKGLRGI